MVLARWVLRLKGRGSIFPGMDKKPKRGRGRPQASPLEKQQPITFRLSARERAVIDHAIAITGTSRTEFIRETALAAAREIINRDQEHLA